MPSFPYAAAAREERENTACQKGREMKEASGEKTTVARARIFAKQDTSHAANDAQEWLSLVHVKNDLALFLRDWCRGV